MDPVSTIKQAENLQVPERQDLTKDASTKPKFGEIWNNIQAKYGEKPKQQREIKKTLDKDDFMRLMVTQMKHQDPTQPFKAEQFAAELAQYASVEQLKNLNKSMEKLTSENKPTDRLAMTSLIGKTVSIDRDRFIHTENQTTPLTFDIPSDAKNVKVQVLNALGEVMFEKDIGAMKKGKQSYNWDGKQNNTLAAKTGQYNLRVSGEDENGKKIDISSKARGRVVGVSYEGAEPVFLVGDNQNYEKISFKNISRIDEGISESSPATVGQHPKNFIPFNSGANPGETDEAVKNPEEGSDEQAVKPRAPVVPMTNEQAANAAPSMGSLNALTRSNGIVQTKGATVATGGQNMPLANTQQHSNVRERGFPNGLSDSEEVKSE